MSAGATYGWKDRPYSSIPKGYWMTRVHWLTMYFLDQMERAGQKIDWAAKINAETRAKAQVDAEDHAASQPYAARAYKN